MIMKFTIFLALLSLITASFIMFNKQPKYYPSRGEQLVNSTLATSAKTIKEKYNIRPCGIGVAMPGGPIQKVALCFDTKYPLNKEQLRELLIKSAQELLNQINENQEIQEHLKELPFTIKNIQIIIYNSNRDGGEVYDPGISTSEISQGILTYQTVDSVDTFNYKSEFIETYEEALKTLNK